MIDIQTVLQNITLLYVYTKSNVHILDDYMRFLNTLTPYAISPKQRLALVPPKPKEFVNAIFLRPLVNENS